MEFNCLVVVSETESFILFGDNVTSSERIYAKNVVSRISPNNYSPILCDFELLDEILERANAQARRKPNPGSKFKTNFDAKMFSCSAATGAVKIDHVPLFIQEDLDNSSVMILDMFSIIYIWVGQKSKANEQRVAIETMIVIVF